MSKTFANDFDDWKTEFERFVIDDIKKALRLDKLLKKLKKEEDNISVGLILLTFIAVESLSGYFVGESKSSNKQPKGVADSESRDEFIEKYFARKYKKHIKSIGELRNSLMHDYGLPTSPNIVMFHYTHESHLETCEKNGVTYLSFNRSNFAKDFLNAWKKYIANLSSDTKLQKKWEKRVNHPRGYLRLIKSPCSGKDWK